MAQKIAMGLDLSLTSTGVAVIGKAYATAPSNHVSRIKTDPKDWDKDARGRDARITYIVEECVRFFEAFNPDLVVIEAPSYGSRFGSAHDRSGLWWRVAHEMLAFGVTGFVPPQSRAKYATGKGNADKAVVEEMARQTYAGLRIEWPTGKCDDIADAVVLAAMGMRKLGAPLESETTMTMTRLTSMDGVEWCGL